HTYLDGIGPFIYLGLWAMRASHSTATLSPGGTRGLYGLLVHAPSQYFPVPHRPSGWAGLIFVVKYS
ncbi:hypothetical protein BJV74DRAFT_770613, partial [Russula compacta]